MDFLEKLSSSGPLAKMYPYPQDQFGWTVLHYIAMTGNAVQLEKEVFSCQARNFFVDPQDLHGESPLHIAAFYGHMEIVEVLLKFGSDITLRNNSGKTPKDIANEAENFDVFKKLDKLERRKSILRKWKISKRHGNGKTILNVLVPRFLCPKKVHQYIGIH